MNKPRCSFLLLIIIFLVIILALAELAVSHHLAAAGEKVRQWEKQAEQLEQKNRFLSEEINQLGSLTKISVKAEELGLVRSTQVWYLTPLIPVALK